MDVRVTAARGIGIENGVSLDSSWGIRKEGWLSPKSEVTCNASNSLARVQAYLK